jgi:hypothetical protein
MARSSSRLPAQPMLPAATTTMNAKPRKRGLPMSDSAATKLRSIRYDELIAKLKAHDAAREKRRAAELRKRGSAQIIAFPASRIVRHIRYGTPSGHHQITHQRPNAGRCGANRSSLIIHLFPTRPIRIPTMASSKSEILNTMRSAAPNISDATHTTVMNALADAGHIRVDDDPMRAAASDVLGTLRAASNLIQHGLTKTPMQASAANPNNKVLLRQVRADCARIGYDLRNDAKVDSIKLTECMKTSGASIESRMGLREALHALHLIEH